MFDQLAKIVSQAGQQVIVDNPEIPNEQNEAVLNEANSSIQQGLQQIAQEQGPSGLKNLFAGVQQGQDAESNPQMQMLSNNVAGNMMSKLGINGNTAKAIAGMLIPIVVGKLFNKTKDPNDSSMDIGGLLGSLMGGGNGGSGGLGSVLGGMFGGGGQQSQQGQQPQVNGAQAQNTGGMAGTLSNIGNSLGMDKDKDGDTDLQDLMAMFK